MLQLNRELQTSLHGQRRWGRVPPTESRLSKPACGCDSDQLRHLALTRLVPVSLNSHKWLLVAVMSPFFFSGVFRLLEFLQLLRGMKKLIMLDVWSQHYCSALLT